MIDKNIVKTIVEEWLKDKEYFLVDVEISSDNKIVVEIDHADGVWIEDCVELGQPFKVEQQYHNFVGKEVEVLTADGVKLKGVLKSVDGRRFTVTVKEKVKVEGKKRPVLEDVDHDFSMDEVKYTKYLISFK